jgi:hypothetical protein
MEYKNLLRQTIYKSTEEAEKIGYIYRVIFPTVNEVCLSHPGEPPQRMEYVHALYTYDSTLSSKNRIAYTFEGMKAR